MEEEVYGLYKPLRNHLRKISLGESLHVIWAYDQYLTYGTPLLSDIEADQRFTSSNDRWTKISPWELETLAREVIINSNNNSEDTFKRWLCFAGGVNKLKDIENGIAKKYININNIQSELNRIAHRQFRWQERPTINILVRYFKIFSYPGIDVIVRNKIGIDIKNLYLLGMALFGYYLERFSLNNPPIIQIPDLSQDMLDKVLSFCCREISELKTIIIREQQLNEKFSYAYSSLRRYPVIKMNYFGAERLVCPLPELFMWEVPTTGGRVIKLLKNKNRVRPTAFDGPLQLRRCVFHKRFIGLTIFKTKLRYKHGITRRVGKGSCFE